jgi:anti-sigma regulatory factor (Ser/Thr protein kinase)
MALHELFVEPQVSEIARLINWVDAACRADGVPDDTRVKLMLAVEEAVMNVMVHAFAGLPPPHTIKVRLDIAEAFAAEVIDNGHPFDPTSAPTPDLSLPPDQRRPGGLGIHLMRGMMDHIRYRRSDGHNILRLEKTRT